MDLSDGWLGDRYPLCEKLPERSFLRAGAKFEYLGAYEPENAVEISSTSQLYLALCQTDGSMCTFPSKVTLSSNLVCDGVECEVDSVKVVKLSNNGKLGLYKYEAAPCVQLAFFSGGFTVRQRNNNGAGYCGNPEVAVGGAACMDVSKDFKVVGVCRYQAEGLKYSTLQTRCESDSGSNSNIASHPVGLHTNSEGELSSFTSIVDNECSLWLSTGTPAWTSEPCLVQAQINTNGFVAIVHSQSSDSNSWSDTPRQANNNHAFSVPWHGNVWPTVAESCTAGCTIQGSTCLCDITISQAAVFTSSTGMPTHNQITQLLTVGSAAPDQFDAGLYSKCATSTCTSQSGIEVYHKAPVNQFDKDTIFKLTVHGSPRYLLNMVSTVKIGTFSFRNPPHFMSLHATSATIAEATHETESLIDHLFHHSNTAPFISHLLIQRFTLSNPSPRYVQTVAEAFRTGSYNGHRYSGKYGDLAATLAAVLLDREARDSVLDADPGHGKLREPLLKVLHLMRAMEYTTTNGRAEVELNSMSGKIGQQYTESPTVFNFYLPDYQPMGIVAQKGLVAPEAQLFTGPYLVGFLNGIRSLITNGLTDCDDGFGNTRKGFRLPCNKQNGADYVDGQLSYTPVASTSAGIVAELDILLTSGKLDTRTANIITRAYESTAAASTVQEAFKVAMQLITASAQFHSTNINKLAQTLRQTIPQNQNRGRRYKAVIVLYLNGGMDSHNLLVPHSGCTNGRNLYEEYKDVRGILALDDGLLLQIDAPSTTLLNSQPCSKFGIHPNLPKLRSLYNNREAMFFANIGSLIEPLDKAQFHAKTKRTPPGLFSHNKMNNAAETLHPQKTGAKGVLGRIMDELGSNIHAQPFRTASYSIEGNMKILENNGQPADIIDKSAGVKKFTGASQLGGYLSQLLPQNESTSHHGETYSSALDSALKRTVALEAVMDTTPLTATWGSDTVSKQFKQVARLIGARNTDLLQTERAAFVVQLGAFDAHSNANEVLASKFDQINAAIASFVQEMENQGMWDDVAIVQMSEFGRTLSPNGYGADHAWAGTSFMLSGSLEGRQILGDYPTDLSEDNELNIGRGRLLPTLPWEAKWKAIAEWLGVGSASMPDVLPNAENFPTQLFSQGDLFTNQ